MFAYNFIARSDGNYVGLIFACETIRKRNYFRCKTKKELQNITSLIFSLHLRATTYTLKPL